MCEYSGELITSDEEDSRESDQCAALDRARAAPLRERAARPEHLSSSGRYIFALDHFLGAPAPLCLDARLAGGVGRFVNHGDAPNLTLQPVFTPASGAGSEAFYRVALFAGRDIPSNEELLFSYGDQYIMKPPRAQ